MTQRLIVAAMGTAMMALVLAGCSTVSADCKDMRVGECKVSAARLLTDTTMNVEGLGGAGVNYSSSPNAQAMTDTMKALTEALALALTRGATVNYPPPGDEFTGSRGTPPLPPMRPMPPVCPSGGVVARVTPPSAYIERMVETRGGPLAHYEGI